MLEIAKNSNFLLNFTGVLDKETVLKKMSEASFLVLPSYTEGFPNVLLEAMACGTQIVATDCVGGTAEILANGKWGKLVAVNDDRKMATTLLASLKADERTDTTLRTRDFDINVFFESIENILVIK